MSNEHDSRQCPACAAPHSDELAVDRFASSMKAKLAKKRDEGRNGWDDPEVCSMNDLKTMLLEHVVTGDVVDIANFCMMIHQRKTHGPERNSPDRWTNDGEFGMPIEHRESAATQVPVSVVEPARHPGLAPAADHSLANLCDTLERLRKNAEHPFHYTEYLALLQYTGVLREAAPTLIAAAKRAETLEAELAAERTAREAVEATLAECNYIIEDAKAMLHKDAAQNMPTLASAVAWSRNEIDVLRSQVDTERETIERCAKVCEMHNFHMMAHAIRALSDAASAKAKKER